MTTTTPETASPKRAGGIYEREARSRKVLRLCMSIDGGLALLEIDPFSARAMEAVLGMTDAAWNLAASHAKVPAPSALTKLAVESVYAQRLATRRALQKVG